MDNKAGEKTSKPITSKPLDYICSFCGLAWSSKPTICTCGSIIDSDISKPYCCGKCGKVYQNKGSLKRHEKDECNKEPKFNCEECKYKTKQKSNLDRHIRTQHPSSVMFSVQSGRVKHRTKRMTKRTTKLMTKRAAHSTMHFRHMMEFSSPLLFLKTSEQP
ncbi:zinc finger protein 808-like [Cataglyphis hispanica]|uniref:zinc finger protein 808-like n=1 Tax=Cataglyphis hispanica TaxID=1086592 RepID=UPI00218029D3|nr:zinc finger protein 808-like [Cataglyphis hispanica]